MSERVSAPGFVLLRHPLLPLSQFEQWRLSADQEQHVLGLYERPWLEEALYVSSPSLHARLLELRAGVGDLHRYPSERRKLIASLARFLSRAAYRCTPFGLFAQIQVATVSEEPMPDLLLPAMRRGIHLDGGVEASLVERALADRSWRETLRWQINTTAFPCGSHLSYVDWVYQANRQRSYRAVELARNEALDLLLDRAQSPQTFAELREALVCALEVEPDEASEFLHELIERHLLQPLLAPTANEACSLDRLLAQTEAHPATAGLREVQAQLHALRAASASTESLVEAYRQLRTTIEAQIGAEDLTRGVLQIDTVDERPARIDPALAAELVQGLELLTRYTARRPGSMQEYKRLFRERFEDREVNLAYALHPELGVPYPQRGALASPLLEGLRFGAAPAGAAGASAPTSALDRLVLRKLFEAGAAAALCISEQDLSGLGEVPEPELAEGSYAQLAQLPAPPGVKPRFELRGLAGRNGLELVARFCHLSPSLTEAARRYAAEGRDPLPDCIYAEIVHHPQDRMLNILRRPALASHELVYAGASDLPRERQLWLNDLTVQLQGEQFILRERRSGRRVIPRLTSAHNYSARQLGAYEFLASLQHDDGAWAGYDWPASVQHLPRLPRLEIAGLIVQRARWQVDAAQIQALNAAHSDGTLPAWREALGLPRYITWDQHDNHLPVDLDNPASVSLLLDEIIKLPQTTLHECLALNAAAEHGCYEQHSLEWVMPLCHAAQQRETQAPPWQPLRADMQDEGLCRPQLEDWLYLRIYTGAGYADRVLRELLAPVLREARQTGLLESWFVVRFQDRFEHLRLRVRGQDRSALLQINARLHEVLAQGHREGLLWRVQSDDYLPELSRYGGAAGMALCERLFEVDSDELLALLDLESALGSDAQPRWLYALASVDAYAAQLSPDPQLRERLLDTLARQFLEEQAGSSGRSAALVAIGARFREFRRELEAMQRAQGSFANWQALLALGAQRRAPLLEQLRQILEETEGLVPEAVLHSLLHMHCNRLSPSEPRRHEMLLYDFARRLQRARQARSPKPREEAGA